MLEFFKSILARPGHIDLIDVLLIVGGAVLLWILWILNRNDNKFKIVDLLLGPDNKASLFKFAQLGSFLLTSWGFVHLTWNSELTEWYYTFYMFAWAGASLMNKYLTNKKQSRLDGTLNDEYLGRNEPMDDSPCNNSDEYDPRAPL